MRARGLLVRGEFARQDADEDDVIDPEHDLERRQRYEREQSFRSQELVHSCKKMLTPGCEVSLMVFVVTAGRNRLLCTLGTLSERFYTGPHVTISDFPGLIGRSRASMASWRSLTQGCRDIAGHL